jgi:hypothetical protein
MQLQKSIFSNYVLFNKPLHEVGKRGAEITAIQPANHQEVNYAR